MPQDADANEHTVVATAAVGATEAATVSVQSGPNDVAYRLAAAALAAALGLDVQPNACGGAAATAELAALGAAADAMGLLALVQVGCQV